ncbi:MAG: malonyl-CoA synthase [Comamonadaceae bacterium]|nr:MAG: malonyl-CoA synthase [Comamonadaceae bacterium]
MQITPFTAPSPSPPDHNLFTALRAAFPAELETLAIETEAGATHSWGDIERGTARLANLFDELALPPGSRIVAQVDKSVQALLLYLATLRAGHVFVPLNTAYQAEEVGYFLQNAEPALVVCASRSAAWIGELAAAAGIAHCLTLDADGSGSLTVRAAGQSEVHRTVRRTADDLASIIYTSGTTGRSKGAMLGHGNLFANAALLRSHWGWRPDDVLIHALPIFHVHGLFVAVHGALINGSRMIWLDRFDAATVVRHLPRATVFMGVPTFYVRLLAEPALDRDRVRNMRLFLSGSAPLQIETFNEWTRRTGHEIVERYGMSETVMLTSNPSRPEQGRRRAGTVGPALPGVRLRIENEGGPVPAGEIGGIEVAGPSVFAGYWRMPEKTREEFTADGFFRTGDVGRLDADGFLTIVGRSKDLIISGGYNVYPAEIELCLNELDGVEESAVVGVPHPDFGEVGIALVVARAGAGPQEGELLGRLKDRLANFKIPKRCFVVGSLPRNAMGKVQKNLLRAEHAGLFARAPAGPAER